MKTLPFLTTGLLTVAMAASPRTVTAEPIEITFGTLVLTQFGGVMHLEGARGLVLDARGDGRATIMECDGLTDQCDPGRTVTLNTGWLGSTLGGQATIDGETFPVGLGTETTGAAVAIFSGSILMPAFSDDESVSVAAPFTFFGRLSYPAPLNMPPSAPVDLTGQGTATVDLAWVSSGAGSWDVRGATYLFEPTGADPIPEPTTLILVGSGLGASLIVKHRARRTRRSFRP